MKTKIKNRKTKIIAVVAIFAMVFTFLLSCNRNDNGKYNAVVAATKLNIFYVLVDNPVAIAVSRYGPDEVEARIDNGKITKIGAGYIVNPVKLGHAVISLYIKKNKISEAEFRVRLVPDPVAKVAGIKSTSIKDARAIDQIVLLKQKGIYAELENFDLDVEFNITEFTVSAFINGEIQNVKSNNHKFTQEQFDLIKKVPKKQKVIIEEIKAIGPDRIQRDLEPIVLVIE